MTAPFEISPARLARLIGLPDRPLIWDVRDDDDFAADPHLIPGAVRWPVLAAADPGSTLPGRPVVVVCKRGAKLSQGTAAWLRQRGIAAESLEGGMLAWRAAGQPLLDIGALPPRDAHGRTVWVTRTRPKIDRIACPWLIRRFADEAAVFLFVSPAEVPAVAERFDATPFDIEGAAWSHRGELCTFDVMIERFALDIPALTLLATIVRGADTARLDLAPQAAGLLAVSLGLSRMEKDDNRQLEASLIVYDALYRWCRDATDETHNWVSTKGHP